MSVPEELSYTKDHEWIRISGETAEVGITDYAQQQLGDVVYVDLPDLGTRITAGEAFGSVESVKAVSDLFAPMTGVVTEGNTEIKDHPEVMNKDPHTAWIIRMHLPHPADTQSLLDSTQYGALLE